MFMLTVSRASPAAAGTALVCPVTLTWILPVACPPPTYAAATPNAVPGVCPRAYQGVAVNTPVTRSRISAATSPCARPLPACLASASVSGSSAQCLVRSLPAGTLVYHYCLCFVFVV